MALKAADVIMDSVVDEPSGPASAVVHAEAAEKDEKPESELRGQKRKAQKGPSNKSAKDPKRAKASEVYGIICQHAKGNRLLPAMDAFKEAVQEELPLMPSLYNTLLYLSCGGNNWEAYARGTPLLPPAPDARDKKDDDAGAAEAAPPPSKEELVSASDTIWSHMQRQGIKVDNVTYVSLARIEAIKGNAAGALHWAKTCIEAGQPVQLRLFHPALLSYTLAGDVCSVMSIDAEIASLNKETLDLTEYEYAILVEALTQHGTWVQLAGVFQRIGKELNQLSPSTLSLIEAYFSSPRAAEAFGADSRSEREAEQQQLEQRLQQQQLRQQEEEVLLQQQRKQRRQAALQKKAAWEQSKAAAAATAAPWSGSKEGEVPTDGAKGEEAPAAKVRGPRSPRHTGSPTATPTPSASSENSGSSSPTNSSAAVLPAAAPGPGSGDGAEVTGVPRRQVNQEDDEAERRRRRPWLGYGEEAVSWRVQSGVEVDASGASEAAGAPVQLVDLEEEEWSSFANAVAALAMRQETRKDDFQHYMDWYERNGPYDVLIDGANVAYFGQNREGGGFCWRQIICMVKLAQRENPGKKVLLMLHKKRTVDPEAQTPEVQAFLEELRRTRSFYFTPPGSNDDWYWLYATVRARRAGLLISNDLLRDHIWNMLRPKHFLKWKVRHIANYSFYQNDAGVWEPAITLPAPFTQCVQELSNGAWMFPGQDGKWLCARPATAGGEARHSG